VCIRVVPFAIRIHSIGRGILSGNLTIGSKTFVPGSASAHSKAKMRGNFEPNRSLESRSDVGNVR
jgi:hypothetical protein